MRGATLWLTAALTTALLAPAVPAAPTKAEIAAAVEKGVKYLKSNQQQDGSWSGNHRLGGTALAALALLESGVPADDPVIRKAAQLVRESSVTEGQTYHIALYILLLDKLDEPGDSVLIQSLGLRLLAGQKSYGGWSYNCPTEFIDQTEQRRLQKIAAATLTSGKPDPAPKPAEKPTDPADKAAPPKRPDLDPEIAKQLNIIKTIVQRGGRGRDNGDNSNTQFGLMGLWAARRHGVPVREALAGVEGHFRQTQDPNLGGWAYHGRGGSEPPMTCAGLLGLAVAHGMVAEIQSAEKAAIEKAAAEKSADDKKPAPKPRKVLGPGDDPAIRGGLVYLGSALGARARDGDSFSHPTYFLWSLERVCVAYGLDSLGDCDWYAVGATYLLNVQQRDGSWNKEYGTDVDTAFALLFLRRANLTSDLTASLGGKVRDPGKAVLKSGVGLPMLPQGPGIDPNARIIDPNEPADPTNPAPVVKNPPAGDTGAEAGRLADTLARAPAAERAGIIERYKEAKGAAYTDALARALPRLAGDEQQTARDALVERLARMSAGTLRDKLADENPEVRRAAALAVGTKEETSLIPDLIGTVGDADAKVSRAARVALRHMTTQDFGPTAAEPTGEQKRAAADQWRAWWAKQKR